LILLFSLKKSSHDLENICKLKINEPEKSFQQPSIDNIHVFHKMKTTTMFKSVKQVFQLFKNLLLLIPYIVLKILFV